MRSLFHYILELPEIPIIAVGLRQEFDSNDTKFRDGMKVIAEVQIMRDSSGIALHTLFDEFK